MRQAAPPADQPGRFVPLTQPFIALGDTQEHESTGFPLVDNDGAVDSYIEVAQRPPEAPLFSRRVLEWVMESHPFEPVVHLSDVLDMSCRSELRRMVKLEESFSQPGVILPGNHDGLLFGIFNYDVTHWATDEDARRWNMGCHLPVTGERQAHHESRNQAVTKPVFIATYLRMVARKLGHGHGLVVPGHEETATLSWRNPRRGEFLEAIEARLSRGRIYSGSFLAQRMALPAAPGAARRVKMIGIDTNQVLQVVGAFDAMRRESPGDIGSVDADQIDAIEPWVEEATRAGDLVVFAGHHNWGKLSSLSRLRLGALMQRLDHPLVYLSAHTHRGFWAYHHVGERPLLELNVSSLSDWPIAYRRIHFEHDAQANRLRVVGDLLPRMEDPVRSDADLLLAWTRATCAKAGVPVTAVAGEEILSVRTQKASRGSFWEWIAAHFDQTCESCKRILFDHAHAYQDQLLATIVQMQRDIGADDARLHEVGLPPHCGGRPVAECAAAIRDRPAESVDDDIARFREKALLVDRVNLHLDDLAHPRAKAYMACRAIIGAKIDFDETDEAGTPGRSEIFRRAQDFFRTEATVGMR